MRWWDKLDPVFEIDPDPAVFVKLDPFKIPVPVIVVPSIVPDTFKLVPVIEPPLIAVIVDGVPLTLVIKVGWIKFYTTEIEF